MDQFFHSVALIKDKCMGCINCLKRCPTEAIRVRNGKAQIRSERCIDCGECIRVCPHKAKQPIFDPLSVLDGFRYKIALPAPSLYGQFNNLDDVDLILNGLLKMGFDEVFEVSKAAEIVSDCTRAMLSSGCLPKPVISSACPAVLRIIRVRFPELLDHILPLHAPIELAARMAKKEAARKTGLPPEDIKAVFISPCVAKVTAVKMPLGTEKSQVDAVVAIRDVYPKLASIMKTVEDPEELVSSGRMGIGWGSSGGEAYALINERYLAADGIENVIRVLDNLEDERFQDLDFVELNACAAGCVGGVLTVENPYVAKAKLKRVRKYRPVSCNSIGDAMPRGVQFEKKVEYAPVMRLDEDLGVAIEKMNQIEEIEKQLKGLDCGSCGAPSCRAMAEDIMNGEASVEDCVHIMRERLQLLLEERGAAVQPE